MLELDPGNRIARARLGFRQVQGEWVREDGVGEEVAACSMFDEELGDSQSSNVAGFEALVGGGFEDDYYQSQSPPYRAANRPLLSVDEIGLIEGFDPALVAVVRPYITVYPYVSGLGVNPNTAPPHILSLIYYNDGVEFRLIKEEDVRRILEARNSGKV